MIEGRNSLAPIVKCYCCMKATYAQRRPACRNADLRERVSYRNSYQWCKLPRELRAFIQMSLTDLYQRLTDFYRHLLYMHTLYVCWGGLHTLWAFFWPSSWSIFQIIGNELTKFSKNRDVKYLNFATNTRLI